jgi:hypothetical protein
LYAPISKDIATSRFFSEEEAIFRAQQFDLIYAKSGMLYRLLPDASRSTHDPRQGPGPHADGIVGSTNVKFEDSEMKSAEDQLHLNPPNPPNRRMYIPCNHRKTQMVTNNQMGINGKVEIIIKVGRINPRTRIIMEHRTIKLERARKKSVRLSFFVNFVQMITLHTYAPNLRRLQGF